MLAAIEPFTPNQGADANRITLWDVASGKELGQTVAGVAAKRSGNFPRGSQALALAQDPISAVPKMRDAYTIFAKELGPEDRSTKETEFLLQHFTTSAVNVAKQAKLGKKEVTPSVKISSAVKPVGPEVDGIGSRGLQNIDELVKYIGGVDVARTAAQRNAQKKRRGGKR